jgi:hypothetical protein
LFRCFVVGFDGGASSCVTLDVSDILKYVRRHTISTQLFSAQKSMDSFEEIIRDTATEHRVSECGSPAGRTATLDTLDHSSSLITPSFSCCIFNSLSELFYSWVGKYPIVGPGRDGSIGSNTLEVVHCCFESTRGDISSV